MENAQDFVMPRPLLPNEPLEDAVYCAECEIFEQEIIGDKIGSCMGHLIQDSSTPMVCQYNKNGLRLMSVFVFLKSGISVYHKAVVKNLTKEMDPGLISSFLQAINLFGQELADEQISLIKFQKMNIVFCRGNYSNGAMIIKGNLNEESKEVFSLFLQKLEDSFPDYFMSEYNGLCLPEDEVDDIAIEFLKDYARGKYYPISPSFIENSCQLKCGKSMK
jgi:hypothetical protein